MSGTTIRHAALLQSLAKQLKLPRQTVGKVLGGVVATLESELKNGKRVQIKGLGMIGVRETRSTDSDKIGPARKRVVLVAAKELKSAIEN